MSPRRASPPGRRLAAAAAVALGLSLLLPWYEKSFFAAPAPGGPPVAIGDNLSAFGVFSFIEAAVLLGAGAVLWLVWARAQGKGFHLPGGDGTAIVLAAGWVLLLLAWRLFDKPSADGPGATVGIQWGILGPFAAAAALAVAGVRLRAAGRPEPPNPAESYDWESPPREEREPRETPVDHTAVTDVLRRPPEWQGEPPEVGERPPPPRSRRGTENGGDEDEPSSPRTPDRLF